MATPTVAPLEACAKEILCAFSATALRTLQALIDSQVAILQAQIVVYQTQIAQYDILALPVEAAQAIAHKYVDNIKKAAYIVPLNVIAGCLPLGQFNMNLMQSIDVATAVADDLLSEATRLLSYRSELNAIVTELNAAITQFTQISNIIGECLGGTT